MSLMKLRRNRKGFTLIEMMIVIAVIAILAAVLIPKSGLVQNTAKESGVEANARVVQGIIEGMMPRYDRDGVNLKSDLGDKLDGKITNPITGGTTIKLNDEAVAVGDAVVITKEAYTSATGTKKGIVWVHISDDLGQVIITPVGNDGNEIKKGQIVIK